MRLIAPAKFPIAKGMFMLLLCLLWQKPAFADDPIMDAQWKFISDDGNTLRLQLGIRTHTSSLKLGSANFIFNFDATNMSFASGGDGVKNTDYFWDPAFDPSSSDYNSGTTRISQPSTGTINIIIDYGSGTAANISSTSAFTTVVDLEWHVIHSNGSTSLTWAMNESAAPVFDDVYEDDNSTPFDEGTFSPFSLSELPIQLLHFSAIMQSHTAHLSWVTASEQNNSYFTLERSGDGQNFIPFATIPGAGTSQTLKEYTSYDENPLSGTSYYRLKQTDFDGKSEIFPMAPLINPVPEQIQFLGFNQTESILSWSMQSPAETRLMLYDAMGQMIFDKQILCMAGKNLFALPEAIHWKPGIYMLNLMSGNQRVSAKIFKS